VLKKQRRNSIIGGGLKVVYTGLDGFFLPMQLTDWPLVKVALLLIGLTLISFEKNQF
jgi:hypothetical protein